MPHVIVKLRPEQQKTRLAEAITKNVTEILHYGDESVSVAMEEIKSQDWLEKVYKPDIKSKWARLRKTKLLERRMKSFNPINQAVRLWPNCDHAV